MTAPASCQAWASLDDLPAGVVDMHPPQQWCAYLGIATDVLWSATGRRWRGASLTAEVSLRAAPPRAGESGWPYHSSWGRCGCCAGTAGTHAAPTAVRLPHGDVTAIVSVTIDGAPFTGWQLDGGWLSRTDGQPWPVCGDRTVVVYRYGKLAPDGGRYACVELAVELGRAGSSSPDQPCQLPKRLQSVTRQGISFAALDSMEFLDDGLTGLYSVDLWIKAVNPHGRRQTASVWSPDIPRARKR